MKNRVSSLFAKNGVKILKGGRRNKLSQEQIKGILQDRVALIDVNLSQSNIRNGFQASRSLKSFSQQEKLKSALWLARLHQTFEENPGLFAKALKDIAAAKNSAEVAEIVSGHHLSEALERAGLVPESRLTDLYLKYKEPEFLVFKRWLIQHTLSPNIVGLILHKTQEKPSSPKEISDFIASLLRR